jgi:Natural resistance-associated macrophage protein
MPDLRQTGCDEEEKDNRGGQRLSQPAWARPDHRSLRRRSLGDRHVQPGRGATRFRHRLDDASHLSADGGDPGNLRAYRAGDGPRDRRQCLPEFSGSGRLVAGVLLFIANTINVAADLGAMADSVNLLVGGPRVFYVVAFGCVSVMAQIFLEYKSYVAILKWLTLVLFAYVITLAVVKVPWGEALRGLLVPEVRWDGAFLTTLVAILGTTISPYLFIWQSSQEAEEQRIDPEKKPLKINPSTSDEEFSRIRVDTLVGMAFSNIIAIAIIITTAATLHAHGKTNIETSAQAAEALRPLAGAFAELIFALGIIGTGLLAIPVLAGSTAYAIGEGPNGGSACHAIRSERLRFIPYLQSRSLSASALTSRPSTRSRPSIGAPSSTACSRRR